MRLSRVTDSSADLPVGSRGRVVQSLDFLDSRVWGNDTALEAEARGRGLCAGT